MYLTVSYKFLPKQQTTHTAMVMSHFGIGFETGQNVIADDLELLIEAGDVVCFTGSSGSGKSSLMRAAASQLQNVIDVDELDLGEKCLVDGLECPFEDAMKWLSLCGLSEAQLMLRTPAELSDGQRYRYRLAKGLSLQPDWLLADEFTATLDRVLARVIAFNVRKLAWRERTGFLLGTTHEDILADLHPDVHVRCDLGGTIDVMRSGIGNNSDDRAYGFESAERKKKVSACCRNSNSPPARNRTGRTSLGGITAATMSGSSGS
jgi:ABC-type ATPase with predicted acetyltransferase domain